MQNPVRGKQRISEALQRARQGPGPERDTASLLVKSALAGVLAWSLAAYVIGSPQPTYAPFTALLVVQSTAYRSLLQSARYVLAVVLGVMAAGFAGPLLGENAGAFAVMLAVTLALGRWQRLGTQGIQVSVAGVFAYNALSGTHESMLWEIIMMALLGAGLGLCVSLLLWPPLRYRTAARGIEEISGATRQLLADMAEGLSEGLPERDTLRTWLHRARRLDTTVASAREAVESGAESATYNPRRLLRSSTPHSFERDRVLVEALARAGEQIRSLSYGLLRMCDIDPRVCPDADFLRAYGELLHVVSRAAEDVSRLNEAEHTGESVGESADGRSAGDMAEGTAGEGAGAGAPTGSTGGRNGNGNRDGNRDRDRDRDRDGALRRSLEEGRRLHRELTASVEGKAAWPSHGVLLTDADRLLEEFAHAGDQDLAETPVAQHPSTNGQ